jgi:hypothetical protein
MLKDMAACALAAHGDHGFRPCAIEVGVFDWCFRPEGYGDPSFPDFSGASLQTPSSLPVGY